tara:strand:- start:321 stop:455 length:135 start_codon:yes stop_codon:yes gene_type:complete
MSEHINLEPKGGPVATPDKLALQKAARLSVAPMMDWVMTSVCAL